MEDEFSQLGMVELVGFGASEFPMWSITKYIDDICNNYNKVLQIEKICRHFQNDEYSELWVAKKSVSLFPDKSVNEYFSLKEENYIKLSKNMNYPEMFWHIILNYVRPIVFMKEHDGLTPLVDFISDDAIKIRSLSYNSPPVFNLEGVVSTIIDLAQAGNRNEREEEEHIVRQLGKIADNYRRIAQASQIINDPRTPEGVRAYANKALSEILAKQAILNKKLDIRVTKIDKKA